MSERVTVPECKCAASKFIGGRWVSMSEVTVGETTGTGVVHDAHSCWRCGQELTAAGQARDVVPRVESEAVRATDFFAKLSYQMANPPAPDEWAFRGSSIWGSEIPIIYAALSALGAPTVGRADGMVTVREDKLREYIRHHAAETCEDDENREACERNSLEHFGLAPEPETKEDDRE